MKLGLLSQWFDPEPGGGVVPGVLATGLAARQHDIRVLTGFPNYPVGQIYPGYRQKWNHLEHPRPTVEVRRTPLYPSHNANPRTRSLNYMSFGASAAAHASFFADRDALWVYNSPATVGAVARRVTKRHSIPFLLHVMDVWPDSVLDSGMLAQGVLNRFAGGLLGGIVSRTHEAAALVAVTSPGQQALLQSRGVPEDKLRYVPVWADEAIFFPRKVDRSLLPEPARDASLVMMYAGAMGHVQRLEAAIRAVASTRANVHLVMIGDGVAEPALRALAGDLKARNIHFMGRQPSTTMGALGSAADVHLVSLADTPLMRITMPSKIQSIMALGRPIIAMCAGDAATTVTAAGAGVAIQPGDTAHLTRTLDGLVDDTGVLAAWGVAGRTYYQQQFAQETAITRVESLLAEIAG